MKESFQLMIDDPRAFFDFVLANPTSTAALVFYGLVVLVFFVVILPILRLLTRRSRPDEAEGAAKSGGRSAGRAEPGRAASKPKQGKTICAYGTKVLAIQSSGGGRVNSVTFTGEDPDSGHCVVRQHALDRGIVWERPFPNRDAFRSVHFIRVGDALILPAQGGGVEAVNVHTGAALWTLPGQATLHTSPLAFDDGSVLLVFTDKTWKRIDSRSGHVADSGSVSTEAQLDKLKEGGRNRFEHYQGDMADSIIIGDVEIEPGDESIELRQVMPGVNDDGPPVFPGPGPALSSDNPNLTEVTVRTMTIFDASGSREVDYASAEVPIQDWEIHENVVTCHDGYLILPLARAWGDGHTTALGFFNAATLAPVHHLVYGTESRGAADFDSLHVIDGLLVIDEEDEDPVEHESHDCLFIVQAARGSKPSVVARIPLAEKQPATFYDLSGRPSWSGYL